MSLISISGLEKTFRSRQGADYTAIRDFDLEIHEGEFFCLLGPSGCGKTTVLNIIAGFDDPTRGDVMLDGRPIMGPGEDRGVVFQGDDSLFTWCSALQNVEFGPRLRGMPKSDRETHARKYIELVGLGGQEDKFPVELSGGMKQRIQIARCLANEPKMLLMDEPFGALDAQTRTIMQEQLARIWHQNETPVLFITHDIDEAVTLGSRIGVMTAGPESTLKGIVEVNLGAERRRTDDDFMQVYREVYDMIREEVLQSLSREDQEEAA